MFMKWFVPVSAASLGAFIAVLTMVGIAISDDGPDAILIARTIFGTLTIYVLIVVAHYLGQDE